MNKTIICYFSASGNTKKIALELSNILGCDIFEIEPVNKYTNEDLDWNNETSRTTIESKDDTIRPEIKHKIINVNTYDNVIIGFPVWWYKEPLIIDKFIEENDLTNKNVYIYVTSGGSTYEASLKHLKEKYDKINFISGKTLNYVDGTDIKEWIKK